MSINSVSCNIEMSDIIQIFIGVFTLLAVIVALFGDHWQKTWFGPKLEISIRDFEGDLNYIQNVPTRFFQLEISNDKNKNIANNVMVFLTKVESVENGIPKELWKGEIPLRWTYSEIYGYGPKNISTYQYCDIVRINNNGLKLSVLAEPHNLISEWKGACELIVSVIAKSDETKTESTKIHLKWDGDMKIESMDFRTHFSIKR